jgi:hypothetical protein
MSWRTLCGAIASIFERQKKPLNEQGNYTVSRAAAKSNLQ